MTEVLGKADINLSAMSIADNSDFGILRCVVSDPDSAYKVLKEADFTVKITDVIGMTVPNTPGALALILRCLSDNGIFIEYLYSFANGNSAYVVIRPNDLKECERILEESKVDIIAANDLYKL